MKELLLQTVLFTVARTVVQQEFFLVVLGKELFIKTNYEAALEKASEVIIVDEEVKAAILKRIKDIVTFMETGQCTCEACLANISVPLPDNIVSPSNTKS